MRERSAEEQPPKLKTYSFEMTLIKLFRNYTMYSSCSLSRAFFAILPHHAPTEHALSQESAEIAAPFAASVD